MRFMVENVLSSVIATFIYDVAKYSLGQIKCEKDSIEKYVSKNMDEKYQVLSNSKVVLDFFKNPLIIDITHNYIFYTVSGKLGNKLIDSGLEKKNTSNLLEEEKIIKFLADKLWDKYETSNVIIEPDKELIYCFFKELFDLSDRYFVEQLKNEDNILLYFVTKRMDMFGNGIIFKLNEIIEVLKKSVKQSLSIPMNNLN